MENGGLIGYSKYKILMQLPTNRVPPTLLVNVEQDLDEVFQWMKEQKLDFPVIAKPDQGARGFGVEFIENEEQLKKYHKKTKIDYLVQGYLDDPQEFGVFVIQAPEDFYISSIIQKDFLILYGDGRSTLKELFNKHPRASKYFTVKDLPLYTDRILEVGEKLLLEPIGNHCRGTKFVNANSIIDEKLTQYFKELTESVPGFYYGRFDIKAPSVEALCQGEFKVLELNGASAEPGHIYDPKYKLKQAYKDLFWHWKKMSEIVEMNRKKYPKENTLQTLRTVLKYYLSRG